MSKQEQFVQLKGRRKIAAVTAYDFSSGYVAARSRVDLILVGDSMGMVVMGQASTTGVELEEIERAVSWTRRGMAAAGQDEADLPLLAADLPFKAMEAGDGLTRNARRLVREGGADAVKIEGGREMASEVARMVADGIPVVGHVGLQPQRVSASGGWKVQAKTEAAANALLDDVRALCDAGIFAVVLELVAHNAAAAVTERVGIPTIGIGSGSECDGQIQVLHDLLGLTVGRRPRHAGLYLQAGELMQGALERYVADVRAGTFRPAAKSSE